MMALTQSTLVSALKVYRTKSRTNGTEFVLQPHLHSTVTPATHIRHQNSQQLMVNHPFLCRAGLGNAQS